MLIKFTASENGTSFYMRPEDVLIVNRHKENLLQTVITTMIMTPKGPMHFVVNESVDEVGLIVNAALSGRYNWIAGKADVATSPAVLS